MSYKSFNLKIGLTGVYIMVGNVFGAVIGLVLSIVVIVNVFIPTVKDANTSSFSAAELALWGLITLGAIAGTVYSTLRAFGAL